MLDMTDSQIESMLAEVSAELKTVAKNEKSRTSRLRKAIGDEPDGDEGSAPPAAEGSAPPGAEASAPPGADEGSAPPPGDEGAPPGAEAPAPGGDPAAEAQADPAQLQAEYSAMDVDQLKMHAAAAVAALQAKMGAPGGDPAAGGAPDAMPPSAPPGPEGSMMGKSEKALREEVAQLKKSLVDQESVITTLTSSFTKFVGGPVRKSETDFPAGTPAKKELSREEASAKLKARIPDQLKKSDRGLINDFFLNPNLPVSAIEHLIK